MSNIIKPTIIEAKKDGYVFWQGCNEDQPIPEPALMIETYSDCVQITQGENYINLNFESLPELAKLLKQLQPAK